MEFTSNGEVTVQEYIWFTLIDSLNNPFAAAAMMGWIYSISRFDTRFVDTNSIDADAYTHSVDTSIAKTHGTPMANMKEFRIDNVGYGIVGWKDWIEKQGLWCMARRNAASISDLRTQMQLLVSTFDESRHYDAIMRLMNSESLEEAVDRIQTGTRHYAKRQMTFLRREDCIHYVDTDRGNAYDDLYRLFNLEEKHAKDYTDD